MNCKGRRLTAQGERPLAPYQSLEVMMSDTDTKHKSFVPEEFAAHAKTAAQEARHALEALLPKMPEDFWQHRRAARREALLAMRSLIDAAVERTNR